MIDWSQPQSLARVTDAAGLAMSDAAFVSGLDESTVSRLWEDPNWLDRVSGKSLQALTASVPGVAEYFATHSVLSRRNLLLSELESHGLSVNRPALQLSSATEVPHQYLINALDVALTIMRGDDQRACSYLARFWGRQQDKALQRLYAARGHEALLEDPSQLVAASIDMAPRLSRKNYSFHSILAQASFAHHVGMTTGKLEDGLTPPITDRQSALMVRSGIMGLLIKFNDTALAQRYEHMVQRIAVLHMMEEWSFPTYARDSKPNADFALPGSILLKRTADEVIHEVGHYSDAYVYYLCTTYLPLALERDSTFGLRLAELGNALTARGEVCEDAAARRACIGLASQIREIT
jgi:hypothetical protein